MVAIDDNVSPVRTVYRVGGMGVSFGLEVDVAVGVAEGGWGVGVSVGIKVGVNVRVGVGSSTAARGRNSRTPPANSTAITPAMMATVLHENA